VVTSTAAQVASTPSRRRSWPIAVLAVLVPALAVLSIAVGSVSIPLDTLWHTVFGGARDNTEGIIVWQVRLPRTAMGVAVGIALGLAGAVMQGVTRNPLGDPGLLGLNSGAALAVVVAISAWGITSPSGYVWFALAGAGAAALVVNLLAAAGGPANTGVTLALAGMAFAALAGSVITLLVLRDSTTFDQLRFWQVGAIDGRGLDVLGTVGPFLLAGAVLAALTARGVDALSLGEDTARALGQRVGLTRAVSALAVTLLCGGATAAAGPIAFVGLAVPHLARLLCGPGHRRILAVSLLLGPALLLTADILGRVVNRPSEVPVGILTAVIGAPVLLALVRRRAGASR
jgi:iron complex transport system permease protein